LVWLPPWREQIWQVSPFPSCSNINGNGHILWEEFLARTSINVVISMHLKLHHLDHFRFLLVIILVVVHRLLLCQRLFYKVFPDVKRSLNILNSKALWNISNCSVNSALEGYVSPICTNKIFQEKWGFLELFQNKVTKCGLFKNLLIVKVVNDY